MDRKLGNWKNLGLAVIAGLTLSACDIGSIEDPGADGGPQEDTFTMLYNSATFQTCAGCHAPGADGFDPTAGTEATMDWSTRDNAYSSLQGMASGLVGNFEGCNGVPLIGATPETSLLVATFDEDVRLSFAVEGFPDCTGDSISDMNLKIGSPISQVELDLLKAWIAAGAPNQ